MEFKCRFDEDGWTYNTIKHYRCIVENQQIMEENEVEFIGDHLNSKINNDVTFILFNNCSMFKLPQGISKCFPNLQTIDVLNSKLKTVSKNDFIHHKKLKAFHCNGNDIEFVPGDLFDDSKGIEWIGIREINLKVVEPNLLDKIENLKRARLLNEKNFEGFFTTFAQDNRITKLQDVKNYLAEKFFILDSKIVKNFLFKIENPIKELEKYTMRIKSTETILKMKDLKLEIFQQKTNEKIQQL